MSSALGVLLRDRCSCPDLTQGNGCKYNNPGPTAKKGRGFEFESLKQDPWEGFFELKQTLGSNKVKPFSS